MGLLSKKTEEEKAAEAVAKEQRERERAEAKDQERAERAAAEEAQRAFVATLPRWEYQVKRVGEDKQKGILGSTRMEEIFNGEGAKGWELIAIHEERATFRRQLPPANQR
jgi:hypothetical protein